MPSLTPYGDTIGVEVHFFNLWCNLSLTGGNSQIILPPLAAWVSVLKMGSLKNCLRDLFKALFKGGARFLQDQGAAGVGQQIPGP